MAKRKWGEYFFLKNLFYFKAIHIPLVAQMFSLPDSMPLNLISPHDQK